MCIYVYVYIYIYMHIILGCKRICIICDLLTLIELRLCHLWISPLNHPSGDRCRFILRSSRVCTATWTHPPSPRMHKTGRTSGYPKFWAFWHSLKMWGLILCHSNLGIKKMNAFTTIDWLYGVISKFLYPDSDEKRFHCVFTGLRLISSIAPTNLKYRQETCEWLISIKTLHT